MMVLVDTSIWIDHLRYGDDNLRHLLNNGQVLCHPFVIGDLACGNLRNRSEILQLLAALPSTPLAQDTEVLHLITERRLFGQGLGWIDVHLLASALLERCELWTLDVSLRKAATNAGITFRIR